MAAALITAWGVAAAQIPDPTTTAPEVRFSTGSSPAAVTVGDRFRALVRVSSAPGARVEFAPALPPSDAVQQTDSLRVLAGEAGSWTAVYPLVAWRTGSPSPPAVPVRVVLPDGAEQRFEVRLRLPEVSSVLPADTAGIEPRPAKDIVAGRWNRRLAGLLVLGIAFLLLAAVLLWRIARERRRPDVRVHRSDPLGMALDALDRAGALPVSSPGERKVVYSAVSDALRHYLAALSPRWSTDLTTGELLSRRATEGVEPRDSDALASLLREADAVKFARHPTTPDEAERYRVRARDWVRSARAAAVPPDGRITEDAA